MIDYKIEVMKLLLRNLCHILVTFQFMWLLIGMQFNDIVPTNDVM